MARLFVRLKVRLIANGLQRGWQQTVGLVLGVAFALPVALGGFLLLALTGRAESGPDLAVLTCTALFVGWALFPLLAYGTDETLDPARLAVLPLRPLPLMTGLVASSAVGIAPIATLVVLAGLVVGAGGAPATVVALAAVAVVFALCLTVSRALTTGLSSLLGSRRWRDLVVTLATLAGGVGYLASRVAMDGVSAIDRSLVAGLADPLRWTPPGLAATAVSDANAGRIGRAVLELAVAASMATLLAVVWYLALRRALTSARPSATPGSVRTALIPRILRLLPSDRRTAVAARELRYIVRDPQRRAQWLANLFWVAAPVAVTSLQGLNDPRMVLLSALLAFAAALQTLYLFSWDRDALWADLVAHGDPARDLEGKVLAHGLIGMAMSAIAAVALAAVTGGWNYVPAALAAALAAFATGAGIGAYVSVRTPLAVPEASHGNIWGGSSTGQGCATGLYSLGFFALISLAVAPIGLAGLLTASEPGRLTVALVVGLTYGAAVLVGLVRVAGRAVRKRGPEILAAVSARG